MRYKIALIHNIIPPYRVPLFRELANNPSIDLKVYLCSATHKMRKWNVLDNNSFDYEFLSGSSIEFSSIAYHVNPSIISKLVKGSYDVVILGGSSDFTTQMAYFVSKRLRIPVILWTEGFKSGQSQLGKAVSPLAKYMARSVDALVVPGTLASNFRVRQGVSPEKIFFAPNTVDNDMYVERCSDYKREKKEKLKKDLGIKESKVILFVGQLIKRKGVESLLDAFKKVKEEHDDVCLVLVGDGPLKNELKNKCGEEKIEDVYFPGWVSEEEKIMYYSITDLFVLPTLEDLAPLVINEAMCCGLPIITTTAAGNSIDMVRDNENGYLVTPNNIEEMAWKIQSMISNEEKLRKMGERSLEMIRNQFTNEKSVKGFVKAIRYVCGKKRCSRSHKIEDERISDN